MSQVRWIEGPSEHESLAVALRAILAGAGADYAYDELVSLLGLGAALVAVPDECPGRWAAYGRDAALTEAAGRLGLRLRALHPLEAAGGLRRSAEFAQHFRDSYVPLVRRALAQGQTALAWCGWPSPAERQWGVLCANAGTELQGYTIGHGGAATALSGPAYQVYVVEEYQAPAPATGAPAAWFAHVARVAAAGWQGRLPTAPGVLTGEAAFEIWRAAAGRDSTCAYCGGPVHRCQVRLIRALAACRRSLGAWLGGITDELEPGQRSAAAAWADACDQTADTLAALTVDQEAEAHLATPLGREVLRRAIDELGRSEAGTAVRLASCAGGQRPLAARAAT